MAIVAPSATAGTAAAVEPGDPFLFLEFAWVDAATIQAKVAASAPTTAARILMFDSSGTLKWFSFTGTQSIAITTDGVNGLETACFNAEGEETDHNYHVYAVGKADGTVGFILTDTDDYSAGPFTGWSMPTGYTYCSAPAWYVYNDSSGDLLGFEDSGGLCGWLEDDTARTILAAGAATTYADITGDYRNLAPVWAKSAHLRVWVPSGATMDISADGSVAQFPINVSDGECYDTFEYPYADMHYKKTGTGGPYIRCQGWTR